MKTLQISQIRSYSDEDVMELFQGGYEEAFAEIVTRYRDKVHNFIFRYTRNHLDSEDIVQETFFRVYRCRHSYERIAKFSTWLYTIANNLVRSHYKKNSRMQTTPIEDNSEENGYHIDIVDTEACPDEAADTSMLMSYIQKALDELPVEFREVLVMRDIQNLTYEEIEEITGVPMGTVKSRINRGRVRLQALVKAFTQKETFHPVRS